MLLQPRRMHLMIPVIDDAATLRTKRRQQEHYGIETKLHRGHPRLDALHSVESVGEAYPDVAPTLGQGSGNLGAAPDLRDQSTTSDVNVLGSSDRNQGVDDGRLVLVRRPTRPQLRRPGFGLRHPGRHVGVARSGCCRFVLRGRTTAQEAQRRPGGETRCDEIRFGKTRCDWPCVGRAAQLQESFHGDQ